MSVYDKVIVIEATTKCNLYCPFCAHDNNLNISRYNFNPNTMLRFLGHVGEYAAVEKQAVLISWLGGEPLLLKEVLSVTENIKDKTPLFFSVTTNGTTLSNTKVRNHIKNHYAELTISLDGFSDFHDQVRGKVGLFEQIKNNIKRLVDEAPELKIRINTVLMRSNFELFKDLCDEVSGWGVQEITFNQLGGRDRPEFYPNNRLSFKQVELLPALVNIIEQSLDGSKTKLIWSNGYMERILASTENRKLPIHNCKPASSYMFVNALGTVAPCPFTLSEYGVDISSIETYKDFSALHSLFSNKKKHNQALSCLDCPSTNVHGKFQKKSNELNLLHVS